MQSIFNGLQKPNQMSEQKCLAVFLKDNKWSLAQCVQLFCLPVIWWVNAIFVFLMKVQITRLWIKLHRPLYMHYVRTPVGHTLQKIICYNSKLINVYLEIKSVKLLLVLTIYVHYHNIQTSSPLKPLGQSKPNFM